MLQRLARGLVNTENDSAIASKTAYLQAEMYVVNSAFNSYYTTGIRGRGNSSWTISDKKSYTLKLNEKRGLLGLAKHKRFALVANHSDKTLLRNVLAQQMGRDIYNHIAWSPQTRNVHLVLNGDYRGVYMLIETAKIGSRRIDVPDLKACPSVAEAPRYGFLLEVNQRLDDEFNFKTSRGICFSLKEPDGGDISETLQDYVRNKVQAVEDALFSPDYADTCSANHYDRLFDVASLIDWYLVNEIAKNVDAHFYSSCYLYYDPADGRLHWGPLWDFDIAFGNINYADCDTYTGFYIKGCSWIARLFADPAFAKRVKARWKECKPALLTFLATSLPSQGAALSVDAGFNFSRWPILGTYIWPNAAGYAERTTYQSETDYLATWLLNRIAWLDENVNKL